MTVVYPEGTGVQGNIGVRIVLDIADTSAPSLATEINAASSLDLSCYLYANGWNPSITTSRVTAPRRLCTRQQLQQFGSDTYELSDLVYSYDPQAADADEANEALATLTKGLEVYAVERLGLDARDAAWAAGQYVDIHPIRLGEQGRAGDPTDETAEFQIVQSVIYTAPPIRRAVIAA